MCVRASRRRLIGAGIALVALLAALPAADAQDYPHALGEDHRAVPGRRHRRRDAARLCRLAVAQMGPAGRGREPHRRGRQYRRRSGRQVRARRLHAALGAAAAAGDQPQPLSEARLRPDRVRADHHHGAGAECAGRQPEGAVQERRRADRLREGQSRQGHLRHARQRHDLAPDLRDVPDDGEGASPARALSRLGAGAQRSGRRQRRHHVRQSRRLARAGEGRQAQAARGGDAQAHGLAAGRADDRRNIAGLRIRRPGSRSWRRRRRRARSSTRSMPT